MLGQDNQNNGKLMVLKVATHDLDKKKLDHPVFKVLEKNDKSQWVETGTVPSVAGRLAKLDVKSFDWEGETFYTASLLIKDDAAEESYLVDFKVGNLMNKGILNSLLNIDTEKDIKIGLYTSKGGFPSGSVRQSEEMVRWKFDKTELPEVQETTFKGRVMRDYSLVEKFFVEKLKEFGAKLTSGEVPAKSATPVEKSKAKKEVVKKQDNVKAAQQDELDALSSGSSDQDDLF